MKLIALVAFVYISISREAHAQPVFFNQSKNVYAGPGITQSVVADFNSDGKLDLVLAFQDGRCSFLAGDGKGGFSAPIPIGTVSAPILFMSSSDLNNDKNLDLIVATETQTFAFLGRGNGSFQIPSAPVAQSYPLFVADVNRDGIPDLAQWGVTADCSYNGLRVQLGKGDGTFQTALTPCVRAVDGAMSQNVVVGDFNSDGILDFAWLSARTSGYISIHIGLGGGMFLPPALAHGGSSQYSGIAAGDFNGDGVLDLITANFNQLSLSFGRRDGTFAPSLPPITLPSGSFSNSGGLFVADFDGDGKADIAWGNGILFGRNDGTFGSSVKLLIPSHPSSIQAARDLNGDGRTDLLAFNYNSSETANNVWALLNAGSKFPNAEVAYSAASGAASVAPNSIASTFGTSLATETAAANILALPTKLGGIGLRTRDSTDTVRLAPLYYVSPTQVNFLVPADVTGSIALTIDDGSLPLKESANATAISSVSAGLFSTSGIPAATAARLLPGGLIEPVSVSTCGGNGTCSLVPIDLARGQVFLTLYGTGFRNLARNQELSCTIGGLKAEITFAGAQPALPGLDRLNLIIPFAVPHGLAQVECLVAGSAGKLNPVQILIE